MTDSPIIEDSASRSTDDLLPIVVSVVICTYNRASILEETLQSFVDVRGAQDACVELLIVDNNSNDLTAQVVDRYKAQLPGMRYVFEPELGLSYARNAGIRQARGALVAYVDDDVLFDAGWIEAVRKIFLDTPEASCMGGQSIPIFEGGRPEWLKDSFLGTYGSTLSGMSIKWMLYPEHPYGLNMVFRRDVFARVGMFNPSLGRIKDNLLSMEETEYFMRVSQAGLKVIYNPAALLYHRIPASRTEKDWIMSRYYWQGISSIAFRQIHEPVSRLENAREAAATLRRIIRTVTGGNYSPRQAYWHFSSLRFEDRLNLTRDLGKFRRLVAETVTP